MFGMKNKNVFQKADFLRQLVVNSLGRDCTDKEILSLFARADGYDRGIVKHASDEVRIVLGALKAKSIKPNSAYKYVKVSLFPVHLKEKLYGRRISMRKALLVASDEKYRKRMELENTIFDQGMKALRGLKKCH